MAITGIEYSLIRQIVVQNLLPANPAVLELGEANWYGDVPIATFVEDIRAHVKDPQRCSRLIGTIKHLVEEQGQLHRFDLAKVFYDAFLEPGSLRAIDLNGTPRATVLDLNSPIYLPDTFDLVLNLGTAEHVFNVYQFFKTVHEITKPGGLMIHGMPYHGWHDHGFYNFQPTFYFDLAMANGYRIHQVVYAELKPLRLVEILDRESLARMVQASEIGANALIYVVFQQSHDIRPFVVPMQGYYAKCLSEEGRTAWRDLR